MKAHAKQHRRDKKPRPGKRPPRARKLHLGPIATSQATQKLPTSTTTANGLDTTPDEMTLATTSIVPSSMAASPAASAVATSGASGEVAPTAFGLTASTSDLPRSISPTQVTGIGITTRS